MQISHMSNFIEHVVSLTFSVTVASDASDAAVSASDAAAGGGSVMEASSSVLAGMVLAAQRAVGSLSGSERRKISKIKFTEGSFL